MKKRKHQLSGLGSSTDEHRHAAKAMIEDVEYQLDGAHRWTEQHACDNAAHVLYEVGVAKGHLHGTGFANHFPRREVDMRISERIKTAQSRAQRLIKTKCGCR